MASYYDEFLSESQDIVFSVPYLDAFGSGTNPLLSGLNFQKPQFTYKKPWLSELYLWKTTVVWTLPQVLIHFLPSKNSAVGCFLSNIFSQLF